MIDEKDKRIKELEEENARLRKEKDKITQEKDKIIKEFEEFKAKHSITVDNLKKAMKIKPNSKLKPKNLGAPKGHKGYSRHIPERIDHIKPITLAKCPYCGTKLGKTQEIRTRYVADIKLISKVENTRYDIHRKYCSHCKKLVEKMAPNVLPHARFGLNIMLLIMYLKLGLRLPCNKIRDYFITLFNLEISEAEIICVLRQLVVAFGDYYVYLEKIVKLARVKHSDTTSWRINGKNYFAWIFVACGVVIYKIRKRNNHKVGLAFLGKNQKGNVLVVDRFGALLKLAKKAGFKLQLCWSHILEDSKQLAKDFGAEGKYIHRKLKEIYGLAKGLNHKGSSEMVEQLKADIFQLTLRHYRHSITRKFVNNLYYRDVNDLFRFVTDPEIDPTNNISERELRALVIIRKISNGSMSRRGANAMTMLLSVIQTLRLQKKNVLLGLQEILNSASGY
jgi:hypothetical protein